MKDNLEKSVKRFLKGKFKITLATVIAFAISGNAALGALISNGTGANSIKIGTQTTDASGAYSTAMGYQTIASGNRSTAMGEDTISSGEDSIAMGYLATAEGNFSTAMGTKSIALGEGSLAAGGYWDGSFHKGGQALSKASIALGVGTVAGKKNGTNQGEQEAVAIGYRAKAEGNQSMSLGYGIESNLDNNFIFGSNVNATGKTNVIVLGANSTAVDNALSIGSAGNERQIKFVKAGADDTDVINLGQYKNALNIDTAKWKTKLGIGSGGGSTLISNGTGTDSIKIGTQTTDASGNYSTAIGFQTTASGVVSTAMGGKTKAKGMYSTAMGSETKASGDYSTAMGFKTIASRNFSTAMGRETIATGRYSTAMGMKSIALGLGSLAAGGYWDGSDHVGGQALSKASIALGVGTVAGKKNGSAQGEQEAVAIGYRAKAEGNQSMSLGYGIESNLDNNFIFGSNVDATGKTNVVVLGANSTAVDNALSIGSTGSERQIKFVKAGTDDTDVINLEQHKNALNIDTAKWKTALGVGSGSGGSSTVDLSNYYKKTETYSQAEVNNKLNLKADKTELTLKADKTYVDTELNKKANASDLTKLKNAEEIDTVKWKAKLGVNSGGVDLSDYYNKTQVNAELDKKANKSYVDTELGKKVATVDFDNFKTDTATKLDKKADKTEVEANKTKIENHETRIVALENMGTGSANLTGVKKDIKRNSKEMKRLNKKMNKVGALATAMANVDFQDLNAGEVGIGAGVGHFVGEQAVAVGIAYAATNNLKVQSKWSGVLGSARYNSVGAGITYKFSTK